MKNSILLVFILVTTIGTAQDSSTKKHEIGLGIYSLTNVAFYTSDGDLFFRHLPINNVVNSIQYRYHWEKITLRTNLNYQYHNFPDDVAPNEFVEGGLYYGKIWTIGTRVGVEREFGKGKLHPIIAVDVFYSYGKNTGISYLSLLPVIGLVNLPPSGKIAQMGGFSPSLGIAYQILPSLSVRIETNAEMGWYKQGREGSKENVNAGIYLMLNPVSTLSVNFHF